MILVNPQEPSSYITTVHVNTKVHLEHDLLSIAIVLCIVNSLQLSIMIVILPLSLSPNCELYLHTYSTAVT